MSNIENCRYVKLLGVGSKTVWGCGNEQKNIGNTPVNTDECANCELFKSKYMQFPLRVNKIDVAPIDNKPLFSSSEVGSLVKIRPCGKEYNNKTYVGIYMGDLPLQICARYHEADETLSVFAMTNPAIFVPELKKIVYGAESWWGEIKNEDELKDITDKDIESTWYVQVLKQMLNNDK